MPQRTIRLLAGLAGVLWTMATALTVQSISGDRNGIGALAVMVGLAAMVPTIQITVASLIERHRTILLHALLDALERTERDVVSSITRR